MANPGLAEEFLKTTDVLYDECASGIADLDKIIVDSHSSLTERARTALVPALYAYWERFFRVCSGEFLRSVSMAAVQLGDLNEALASLKLRTTIRDGVATCGHQALFDQLGKSGSLAVKEGADALHASASQLCALFASPIEFSDPEAWLHLGANVRYEVLERNIKAFGLRVDSIQRELSHFPLYPKLKELVDTRNQIAHGQSIHAIAPATWEELKRLALELMNAFQLMLYEALDNERFLRS